MELQISSGRGPAECELAVWKFANALCAEFDDTKINGKTPGTREGCYKSVVIESKLDLSFLDGTVKWICQSPFRPGHKRKNWFIDVSPLRDFDRELIDGRLIRFDTFRSGGKGGQNVNKVETGVRATYEPLSLSVVSTGERSRYANKKLAIIRLFELIAEQEREGKKETERSNWMEHNRLIRGNAIREYAGLDFKRIR